MTPAATTRKNRHAVALGKLGGAAKTPAKAEAARRNGRRGGRPSRKLSPATATAPKYAQ
jgi:hypothetical protein